MRAFTDQDLLAQPIRARLAQLVRVRAGGLVRPRVLDLGSPEGFLADALARGEGKVAQATPGWRLQTAGPLPRPTPGNVEQVSLEMPELPAEDDSLGLITGGWFQETFEAWSPALAEEAFRALAPGGRLVLLFRGPSPRNEAIRRGLPTSATEDLEAAGFENVDEATLSDLPDGSVVLRLAGRVPPPS